MDAKGAGNCRLGVMHRGLPLPGSDRCGDCHVTRPTENSTAIADCISEGPARGAYLRNGVCQVKSQRGRCPLYGQGSEKGAAAAAAAAVWNGQGKQRIWDDDMMMRRNPVAGSTGDCRGGGW